MKTAPRLKVERPKERGIKHAAQEMVDLGAIYYINAASICELVNRLELLCVLRFDAPPYMPATSDSEVDGKCCVFILHVTRTQRLKHVLYTYMCLFYNKFSLYWYSFYYCCY